MVTGRSCPTRWATGYSTKPEDGAFSLDDVAAQYKALLDALGVARATVVGNSQGGAIAITMALQLPDLVEKLVLMAPGGLEARETYMEMEGIKAMIRVLYKEGHQQRNDAKGLHAPATRRIEDHRRGH